MSARKLMPRFLKGRVQLKDIKERYIISFQVSMFQFMIALYIVFSFLQDFVKTTPLSLPPSSTKAEKQPLSPTETTEIDMVDDNTAGKYF